MTASELRNSFLHFFESKEHKIVGSAPMVIKDDPTLMFTNAGMNQFKDIFLGNEPTKWPRVVNSQKCLRVSGKHNDLEEVGHDTYHHTMFEMLGNWSFGDYFKEDAINWAWEFLTEVLKIDKSLLYATVFEGCKSEGTDPDHESRKIWSKHLPSERIINGNKEDNFWEMGETGPCGPCSEIHIDLRSEEDKKLISGETLVNKDHPEVIEVWNLVFIQFNRKADGSLSQLPHQHVDTGMGFERLCRVIQNKKSNYDTSIFQPLIQKVASISGIAYGRSNESDIAMRVISDHIRTISFAITDGQLPSNNKAGYVIRRILRRAVRYAYTFLNIKEPFLGKLLPELITTMGDAYPELGESKEFIQKVIEEEEESFLRTLSTGITMLDRIIAEAQSEKSEIIQGKVVFELYDTFGFPLDLTELILKEHNLKVNLEEFHLEMEEQQKRARRASSVEAGDWVDLISDDQGKFIGYDFLEADVKIIKYREVKTKNKKLVQLVFNATPFYPEGGGQVGDSGYIESADEKIDIINTKKENNLIIHFANELPKNPDSTFRAVVDSGRRQMTANNHTATHLLHKALREILGSHVEQKGSLVHPDYLRFDFSHYQKLSKEEIRKIEHAVNKDIRRNFQINEYREIPISEAKEMGALALFGEKYGDTVRAIKFGDSIELCGGTHVNATGEIGFFKIFSEASIAAGIRRIEAVVGERAEELIDQQSNILFELGRMFKNSTNLKKNVEALIQDNATLSKQLKSIQQNIIQVEIRNLKDSAEEYEDITIVGSKVKPVLFNYLKDIAFRLRSEMDSDLIAILGSTHNDKVQLAIIISDELADKGILNAVDIVKKISPEIKGGGGGQAFFATAGGRNPNGLDIAIKKGIKLIKEKISSQD